jgi:flagellar motor switch protein FliM
MSEASFEPLLSSDETEALLHAMRNNSANTQGAREVDLGSPDSLLRAAQQHAELIVRDFASETRGILRRMMGSAQSVREGNVDVMPFNVFAASIVPGSTVAVLSGEEGVEALLVVGAELTARVMRKKLGSPLPAPEAPPETPRTALSGVDRRLIRAFLQEELDAFRKTWGPLFTATITEIPAKANELPRMSQFESLLRVPVVVNLGNDMADEIGLFMTVKAARLPKPAEPAKKPEAVGSKDRRRIAAQLSHAEVEVVAVLGRAESTIRQVLALEVGDVIRLHDSPDTPLRVSVEGQPKFVGTPVIQHGNLAIEIHKILEGKL